MGEASKSPGPHGRLGQDQLAGLAAQVRFLGTLAKVLPWGLAMQPQWTVVDVVIQDEYTHDIVLGADGEPRALILDCT